MAATIASVITEARYDLRDINSTLYTDAELYYYANRGLIQLDNVLSAMNSDWVYNEASLTLASGALYVAVSTGCMVVRSAWISSDELIKVSPQRIFDERKYIGTGTGQPYYFAEQGVNLIFERTTDQAYTVKAYYDKRATAFSTTTPTATMPYNDEFNSAIREMIVILAHKRNEINVFPDTEVYNFFFEKLSGNVVRRNHVPIRSVLDF